MTRYSPQNVIRFNFFNRRIQLQRGFVFGAMIVGALLAFELFNFSTTEFALGDLLGKSSFMSVRWSTILALAFCGIDFAGIARIFTPEEGIDEPTEIWYLFGAWLLAATMNAMLTWWGVSIAILDHQTLGNAVIEKNMLIKVVPIFVAVMVWLSRVLIIGTFSIAGDRLFSQSAQTTYRQSNLKKNTLTPNQQRKIPVNQNVFSRQKNVNLPQPSFRPRPKPKSNLNMEFEETSGYSKPEPTYHPISMRSSNKNSSTGYQ